MELPFSHDRVKQGPNPGKALKNLIARLPMGRIGQPDETIGLVVYLASDESAFMTGQIISINGGACM